MKFNLWPWRKEHYSPPTEVIELRETTSQLRDIAGTLRDTAAILSEQVERLSNEESCGTQR